MIAEPIAEPIHVRRRPLATFSSRAERTRRVSREAPKANGPVRIGLWLPVTAIFLLLAPFALLATPFLYLAPRRIIPAPVRTVLGIGALLLSLGGTTVEVDAADARIRIRLF